MDWQLQDSVFHRRGRLSCSFGHYSSPYSTTRACKHRAMIMSAFSVAGKNALVTGSTRGLGAAIALALAEAGANVAVHGKSGNGDTTCSSIHKLGRKTLSLAGDVANPNVCSSLVLTSVEQFGSLDILVNNAGLIRRAPAVDYPMEDWDHLIAADLSSVFRLSQLAGRHMLKRGQGG